MPNISQFLIYVKSLNGKNEKNIFVGCEKKPKRKLEKGIFCVK